MEDPYISDASFASQYLQNEELTKVYVRYSKVYLLNRLPETNE